MFDYDIIFIAGVHGVGKSYLCSRIEDALGLPVFSASKIIKETKKTEVDFNKNVIDAEENQNYLITELRNLNPNSKTIILDGHFCLISNNRVVSISTQVFEKLPLKAIFVLYDSPEKIYQKLQERDSKPLSIDIISRLQEKEINHAEITAKYIKIFFEKVHSDSMLNVISKISSFDKN
jgi:adenylate kinase